MISDRSLVIYACVAQETTILAEFTTGDPDLDAIALKCLENVPQFHSSFSHTARSRTYTFLIHPPLLYFGIFHEDLQKSQGLWLLNRIRDALNKILDRDAIEISHKLTSYRFQGELNPIFRDLLGSPDSQHSAQSPPKDSGSVSMDSSRGNKIVSVPLLGKPGKGVKKKKRSVEESNGECKDDAGDNKVVDVPVDGGCMLSRDFSAVSSHRAKHRWKHQVAVVLTADLAVCCVLFGIWLGICRGFQCING